MSEKLLIKGLAQILYKKEPFYKETDQLGTIIIPLFFSMIFWYDNRLIDYLLN